MRFISLLLIALALASMSHQDVVTFGEFVAGAHEGAPERKFKLMESSLEMIDTFVKLHDQIIVFTDPKQMYYPNFCGSITFTANAAPKTTKTTSKTDCPRGRNMVISKIYEILGFKPNTPAELWNTDIGKTRTVSDGKRTILVKRIS